MIAAHWPSPAIHVRDAHSAPRLVPALAELPDDELSPIGTDPFRVAEEWLDRGSAVRLLRNFQRWHQPGGGHAQKRCKRWSMSTHVCLGTWIVFFVPLTVLKAHTILEAPYGLQQC